MPARLHTSLAYAAARTAGLPAAFLEHRPGAFALHLGPDIAAAKPCARALCCVSSFPALEPVPRTRLLSSAACRPLNPDTHPSFRVVPSGGQGTASCCVFAFCLSTTRVVQPHQWRWRLKRVPGGALVAWHGRRSLASRAAAQGVPDARAWCSTAAGAARKLGGNGEALAG